MGYKKRKGEKEHIGKGREMEGDRKNANRDEEECQENQRDRLRKKFVMQEMEDLGQRVWDREWARRTRQDKCVKVLLISRHLFRV